MSRILFMIYRWHSLRKIYLTVFPGSFHVKSVQRVLLVSFLIAKCYALLWFMLKWRFRLSQHPDSSPALRTHWIHQKKFNSNWKQQFQAQSRQCDRIYFTRNQQISPHRKCLLRPALHVRPTKYFLLNLNFPSPRLSGTFATIEILFFAGI